MFEFIKTVMAQLVSSLDDYNFEVCGSYRRGKTTCGDMDIIIARKDGTYEKNLLGDLVRELEKVGFLTDHLTTPRASDTRTSTSYMGVCQFEGPTHHRIDIKYYPI
jgi:DNA polymerase lambda